MTPDRHLGAAWIDKCRPNILISESTYATTIRDSKRCRERDFLKKVHDCVDRGGKVLIPVFALGRAQELCILLETYWERMNLKAPIYFAVGLTEKVTLIEIVNLLNPLKLFPLLIGQQLLQNVHHLDQSKDSQDFCSKKHVRVQTHPSFR
jgi:Cft2 family RNA processing exonuclease